MSATGRQPTLPDGTSACPAHMIRNAQVRFGCKAHISLYTGIRQGRRLRRTWGGLMRQGASQTPMIRWSVDGDDIEAIIDSIQMMPIATIVTDNRQPDNPIIAANEPFTVLTGYA